VSRRPARIVLATHGRFHSFDLAEQLQRAGLLSAIYTPYPKFKLRNTRVDPGLIRSFPFASALHRLVEGRPAPRILKQTLQLYACMAIDAYMRATRPPCDILMALSGSGLTSGAGVQRQGGRYICDRGSTHLRYQMRLLAEEYDRSGIAFDPVHPRMIAREEAEYSQADAITVPSRFAARSFIESGVDPAKLHVLPYGVDLEHFQRTAPRDADFRVLFVGQLSVRKGISYLLKAFRQAKLPDARLVFVGSPTGETKALLGRDPLDDVEFTGPLSREQVAAQMSRASVMVLPSVEEGLAMVQAQALACGCPVIATVNSGAEDIFADGGEGFIVPARDAEAIARALTLLYRDRDLLHAMSQAGRRRMEQIGGWDRYGAQIIALIESLLDEKTSGDVRV
jgi:glycosyltransferase involved in cell wall biosynthesis